MAVECALGLLAPGVPDNDGLVPGSGGQDGVPGREGQGEDDLLVAHEHGDNLGAEADPVVREPVDHDVEAEAEVDDLGLAVQLDVVDVFVPVHQGPKLKAVFQAPHLIEATPQLRTRIR